MNQLPVMTERSTKDGGPVRLRPQSSRGDGSHAGDSLILSSSSDAASPRLSATQGQGQAMHGGKPFMVPRSRSLRLVPGTQRCTSQMGRPPSSLCKELAGFGGPLPGESSHTFRPPSSLLGRDCTSRASAGTSMAGISMSRQSGSLSTRSLSGMSSLSNPHLGRRGSTETPPNAPNAFEAHGTLVKCPAPKRPLVCTLARRGIPVRGLSGLSTALATDASFRRVDINAPNPDDPDDRRRRASWESQDSSL